MVSDADAARSAQDAHPGAPPAVTGPAAGAGGGPVAPAGRIDAIDVLRGCALLGILAVNVQLFAMPEAAYFNPTAWGDLQGANLLVWLGTRLLADQKFMTIFSMLFGAGIVLLAARAEQPAGARRAHCRRMGWLALFGLLHAHLLWAGDILFLYAVCGMLVYPLRSRSPRLLLLVGAAVLCVAPAISLAGAASWTSWPEEARTEFIATVWRPAQAALDHELAAYRGGWLAQLPVRSASAFGFETFVLLAWGVWRAGGLMLVGMALFKLDVFGARRSRRFYGALAAAGLAVGLPLESWGVALDFRHGWGVWSFFQGRLFNYGASLAVGLGYVGLVMLACRTPALRRATRPLAAVGRTALTNYLLQTAICTTLFYGHGLGWYGAIDRLGQAGVVAGVWAVQLAAAPLWLRGRRHGPAEWLWRRLTFLRRPARGFPSSSSIGL